MLEYKMTFPIHFVSPKDSFTHKGMFIAKHIAVNNVAEYGWTHDSR